jgi:hypothetical protein
VGAGGDGALGYGGAIGIVGGLTAGSGLWVLIDIPGRDNVRPVSVSDALA